LFHFQTLFYFSKTECEVAMEARNFLESFQVTDIERDPLPLKVLRNAITKEEILGQAGAWGFEYLDNR